MKKHKFNISKTILEKFFPKERVKTKAQIIEILMETVRYVLLNPSVSEDKIAGTIILYIDRMSRVFFIHGNEEKYFSIVFPFYTFEDDGKFRFTFQNEIEITSQLISKVIAIIKCDEFKEKCSLDFVTPICEYEEGCDENFWILLRELLLMEDGYIRYDYDLKEYENAKARGEEHMHPLNHLDMFYSSNASFKIGLKNSLLHDDFIDILNTKTDCKYMTS